MHNRLIIPTIIAERITVRAVVAITIASEKETRITLIFPNFTSNVPLRHGDGQSLPNFIAYILYPYLYGDGWARELHPIFLYVAIAMIIYIHVYAQ